MNSGDSKGHVVDIPVFISPLITQFRLTDVLEIIVGACVLAIPVAYTEEVWRLGEQLPFANIMLVFFTSITTVAFFVYFVYFKDGLKGELGQFLLRVFSAYVLTILVVIWILTMFDKLPWQTDPSIAIRRVILVGFPACFSATVVDSMDR